MNPSKRHTVYRYSFFWQKGELINSLDKNFQFVILEVGTHMFGPSDRTWRSLCPIHVFKYLRIQVYICLITYLKTKKKREWVFSQVCISLAQKHMWCFWIRLCQQNCMVHISGEEFNALHFTNIHSRVWSLLGCMCKCYWKDILKLFLFSTHVSRYAYPGTCEKITTRKFQMMRDPERNNNWCSDSLGKKCLNRNVQK